MRFPLLTGFSAALVAAGLFLAPTGRAQDAAAAVSLVIEAGQVAGTVSPLHSGLMTEEINHSYDGGLYAELIQNRVFKDDAVQPVHWSVVQEKGGTATITLDRTNPLNDALPISLRLDVTTASASQGAGVANDGYWGIPVKAATTYRASFYARAAAGFDGPVNVSIESDDGSTVYATAQVAHITADWQQYAVVLTTGNVIPTAKARFVLGVNRPGTVWFNLVSLFPPTWKGQPNGFRPDLMQMMVDLKPAFLRFPGGNFLEGPTIGTRFEWKKTLGPIVGRAGHPGTWGYRATDGMGLLEFLLWCEDMGAQPLLAVYSGYSLDKSHVNPGPDLEPYVEDALEEIEYVTGSTATKRGAERAKDGHPAPFPLHYVEIGNEDWFDPSPSYSARFAQFRDAIKERYPELECISTIGNEQPAGKRVQGTAPDAVDEHYYRSAHDFEKMAPGYFEKYDRSGPEIFVGEWAAFEDIVPWARESAALPRTPNMKAALGDAVWMAAMERNADIVKMQCYAPFLVDVNPGGSQWRPDLVGFDALRAYGSPSYYAIEMFNRNRGDVILKAAIHGLPPGPVQAVQYSVTKDSKTGVIYLKLVNVSGVSQPVNITVNGVTSLGPDAGVVTLSASKLTDTNSIDAPTNVIPVASKISGVQPVFTYTLAPFSLTVLQLRG